jgi:hypothetical protein
MLAAVRVQMVDADGKSLQTIKGEPVMDILGMMSAMPRGLTMHLKLWTVAYGECAQQPDGMPIAGTNNTKSSRGPLY